MSTTISTTTTTSVTLDGASFGAALARLRQVGKGRPITLENDAGGFRASVRVTAKDSAHGAVSAHVAGTGTIAGPIVLAAGVTDLTWPDGPLELSHGDSLRIGPHTVGTMSTAEYGYAAGNLTARIPERSVTAPRVDIPAGWFAADVARVAPVAAPAKDVRRILTGVLLDVTADGVTMTATDSYRMHVATFPGVEVTGAGWQAIVPAAFMVRVMREAKRRGAVSVTLHHDAGFTWADVAGVTVATSDIEGQYPDARQLFPVVDEWVGVSSAAVLDALTDLTARAKAAGMVLTPKRGGMLILHRDSAGPLVLTLSGDWGEVTADVEGCTGPPVERMALNLDYFRHAMEAMPNDHTRLGIIAPLRPVTFDSSGANVRALLMPVKLAA